MQKLNQMDLFHLIDKSLYRNQRTFFGSRAWSEMKVLSVLVEKNLVQVVRDEEKNFKYANVLVKETIDTPYLNELLWMIDPKSIKPFKK